MATKIDHGWWTACSACGGNADPSEASHIHGGPDPGGPDPGGPMGPSNPRSYLNETNGCRAAFDEPPTVDMNTRQIAPPHEYVQVRDEIGLLDHDSLAERIRRAEHDAGMPINGLGGRSHCWLCRRDYEERGGNR